MITREQNLYCLPVSWRRASASLRKTSLVSERATPTARLGKSWAKAKVSRAGPGLTATSARSRLTTRTTFGDGLRRGGAEQRRRPGARPLQHALVHSGLGDETGTDRRGAHAGAQVLGAQRVRELDETCLAGSVGDLEGGPELPRQRCDADHVPAPALQHPRQHEAREAHRRNQVDRDHAFQVGERSLVEHRRLLDAGVVDQHVDGSELAAHALQQLCGGVGRGHVGDEGPRAHALARQLRRERIQLGRGSSGEGELHLLLGQSPGDVHADPARGAGDESGQSL